MATDPRPLIVLEYDSGILFVDSSGPASCVMCRAVRVADAAAARGAEAASAVDVIPGRYCAGMSSERRGEVSALMQDGAALARARGGLWLPDPLVTTIDQAGAFVDRVAFAVLFPAERIDIPSLWEAVDKDTVGDWLADHPANDATRGR